VEISQNKARLVVGCVGDNRELA